jgi:phenylalanyl-tRNA synthetase alpha chain
MRFSGKSGGTAEASSSRPFAADGGFLYFFRENKRENAAHIPFYYYHFRKEISFMKELLEQIRIKAVAEIEASDNTEELRIKYLGKKGELTAVLRGMGKVAPAERPIIGQLANEVRATIEEALTKKAEDQKKKEMERRLMTEKLDVTLPGKIQTVGHRHPIAQTEEMLREIFIGMGFSIAEGPEVEYDYYNFEALNLPKNHPARDTQDTFYITDNILLRSQTSPVQVRVMENKKPPIRIISPGRVYRADPADATHSPIFHQVEGLVVDKGITMGDLKGILELFAKQMFGPETKIRFRPHHFPFTEPSAEVDVSCFVCGGKGCRLCKGEGWMEILGAGMVHPFVLSNCGIDPNEYSGFAFGMGVERITMARLGIDDLRLMFENDVRFLRQF